MGYNSIKVRYSRLTREDRTPKNTLVTTRCGDMIYFGIARCNRAAGDTFRRQGLNGGSTIGQVRLQIALEERAANYVSEGNVHLHPKGLRGQVRVENIKELIKFFNNVDVWCYNKGINSSRPISLEAGQ